MKPRTVDTLRALLEDHKVEALHAGRYPTPVNPRKWETRDKARAFRCMAYNRLVREINALDDAIGALEHEGKAWRGKTPFARGVANH